MVLFSRGDVCFPTVCYGKDLDLFLTCAKRNAPSSCPHSAPHFLSFYFFNFFLRVRTAVSWLATPGRTGSTSAPVETHEEGQEAAPRTPDPAGFPRAGRGAGGDLSRSSPREAPRPGGVGPSLAAKTQLPVLPDSRRFVSSSPRLALTLRFVFIYRRNYFQ